MNDANLARELLLRVIARFAMHNNSLGDADADRQEIIAQELNECRATGLDKG